MKKFTIHEFRELYPDDDTCLDKLFQVRFSDLKICPKCGKETTFTRVKGRRCYICPKCGKHEIYPCAGTELHRTTLPLTYWFYACYLHVVCKNGVAAKELERSLDICYKTALRMAHQIKKLMADKTMQRLAGVIEGDESFIGGLNKNRHADKKIPESQGRSVKDKVPVFGMRARDGKLFMRVVQDTKRKTLIPIIKEIVEPNSLMITDEWMAYKSLKKHFDHVVINHNSGEFVRGAFHTNGIESAWAILKRQIKSTHIHVSKKHLQKYVDEVVFRYKYRKNQDIIFDRLLNNLVANGR